MNRLPLIITNYPNLILALAACLDVSPFAVSGGWILSMGNMKRGFKKLRDIWELLIVEDWPLTELFCPPPLPSGAMGFYKLDSHLLSGLGLPAAAS